MKNFMLAAVFFYLTTSFFSVSIEPIFIYVNYFFAGLLFIISIPYFFKSNLLNYQFLKLLSFYYLAATFSIAFGFVFLYVYDFEKIAFIDINLYGRIFNIVLFSLLSWIIVSLCAYKKYLNVKKVIFFYSIGCGLLVVTGYWQSLSLYLGIGSFPFETRSWVHGFNKSEYDIEARLTGIAAEPSYFVPFVLDFMILSLLAFKKRSFSILAFIFGAFIMVLSFSPSGYASTLLAFLLAMLFFIKPNSKITKYLLIIILFIPFIFIFFVDKFRNIGYVIERLSSLSEDGRFRSIYETLVVFFDSNVISLMFGYGATNFIVASQYTNYSFLMTSNNLFADILVETGIIGLGLILCFLLKLFIEIYTSKIDDYQKFLTYALFFDLLATSMIRADYSTSRFFIVIAIIFLLSKYEVYKRDESQC